MKKKMNNEIVTVSDEELDFASGVSSSGQSYKIITVDNGTDTSGTDATGNLVIRKRNDEGKMEREKYADTFEGVILFSKSQIVQKGKDKKWKTIEFNPLDVDTPIAIYTLNEGKFVKGQDGKPKVSWVKNAKELQNAQSTPQPDGTTVKSYDYFVILYVLVKTGKESEIVKLKFKGAGRGNFYDYTRLLGDMGVKFYEITTEFNTYKEDKYFAIGFKCIKNEAGEVIRVKDKDTIKDKRIELYERNKSAMNSLPPAQQSQALPEPEKQEVPGYKEVPQGEIKGEEEVEVIQIEDLPPN